MRCGRASPAKRKLRSGADVWGGLQARLRLANEGSTAEDRKRTLALLMELSHQLGVVAQCRVDDLEAGLLEPGDRQGQLWSVTRMLENGEAADADRLLEVLRDEADPLWLQIHGQRHLQRDEAESGIVRLYPGRCEARNEIYELPLIADEWPS